jgi:hypothetical protein
MKKITLLVLAFLLIGGSNYAAPLKSKKKGHQSETHGYYSISFGPSLALGKFASTTASVNSFDIGAAKTGLHINLANFGYTFTPNVGIAAVVCVGANKFDAQKTFGSDDKDPYWVYGGFMVGPLGKIDAGEKISLIFRPVFGMAYIASPEVNASSTSSTVLLKSDRTTGFGYDLGASMQFHASSHFDLGFNLDYFSAKPKFTGEDYKDFEGKVTNLGITIGVGFRF